jgi:transposase
MHSVALVYQSEQSYFLKSFFVLLSNDIKDPVETLEVYRTKDLVEKALGNLKKRLNMRRESVASEENPEGKAIIGFLYIFFRFLRAQYIYITT